MPENHSLMKRITEIFSLIPLILYTIIAVMLTVIAIYSVYDSASLIYQLFTVVTPLGQVPKVDLISVINALLLTITIIVLFETVTVYFRTRRVEVRTLLVAGVTGVVRHVLIYNVATPENISQLFAAVAVLAVLIAGIVLIKPESQG